MSRSLWLKLREQWNHAKALVFARFPFCQQQLVQTILNAQEQMIITTDGQRVKTVNLSFLKFYHIDSLSDFPFNCICDTFDPQSSKDYLKIMMGDVLWIDYIIQNPQKIHKVRIVNNGDVHVFSVTASVLPTRSKEKVAVFTDITLLENQQKQLENILDNILLPVIITSKENRLITYANPSAQRQYEASLDDIIGAHIDVIYSEKNQKDSILNELKTHGVVRDLEQRYQTFKGREFYALLSMIDIVYNNDPSYIGIVVDITERLMREKELADIHQQTKSSIEYASLIQHALIPSGALFKQFFTDAMVIWKPKNIVGGDIYLLESLRQGDECLMIIADCTGHGVPGAFVTMLVKAIEQQVVAKINSDVTIDVSPAWVLSYFNCKMKKLLNQDHSDSISNAGFDGAVIYYNKKQGVVKFSGAETGLFYIKDERVFYINGDRHSIGYQSSKNEYVFQDHVIDVVSGMQFFLTTDGYLDQNGGKKSFPFGKTRFMKLLESHFIHDSIMSHRYDVLMNALIAYQGTETVTDDVTVIGLKI